MLLQELLSLLEGGYVLYNRSGQRKTFKDTGSPAARAFQSSESTAKPATVPSPKFSQEWWDKRQYSGKYSGPFPDTRFGENEFDYEKLKFPFSQAGFQEDNVDDWSVTKHVFTEIDGVRCAGVIIRVAYSFGAEDDMGLDLKDGKRLEDIQSLSAYRSPTAPATLVFGKYVW